MGPGASLRRRVREARRDPAAREVVVHQHAERSHHRGAAIVELNVQFEVEVEIAQDAFGPELQLCDGLQADRRGRFLCGVFSSCC